MNCQEVNYGELQKEANSAATATGLHGREFSYCL